MKKFIFYSIIIVGLIYIIINFLIGSNLIKFEKLLSSDQRNLIKSVIFPYKYISQLENIIRAQSYTKLELINENDSLKKNFFIKTDGLESFKLNINNKIYFYSNNRNKNFIINLVGVTKNTKIKCFTSVFVKDFILKLKNLPEKCKKSLYFIGDISLEKDVKQKLYFYFGIAQDKNKSKILLILPTTNFYNYSSNIYGYNQYSSKINYIANLNEIPSNGNLFWAEKTADSINNINKNLYENFNVILDYQLEKQSLEKYHKIIFPMHQEYISTNIMNKLINFLENDKKNKIISIGGANFWRIVKLENLEHSNTIIYPKEKYIDNNLYNINTIDKEIKGCKFQDDKNLELGEISLYKNNLYSEYFFYKIKCDENKILPLINVSRFNGNGLLIHFMTDGIGLNFNKIPYLNEKVLELLE